MYDPKLCIKRLSAGHRLIGFSGSTFHIIRVQTIHPSLICPGKSIRLNAVKPVHPVVPYEQTTGDVIFPDSYPCTVNGSPHAAGQFPVFIV